MEDGAKQARQAAQVLATFTESQKNACLERIKEGLKQRKAEIIAENLLDVQDAEKAVQSNDLSQQLLNRLHLEKKFDSLLDGIDQVINLPDPVGKCTYANQVSNKLDLYRVTCPIGVLGIIFEARPEAAVQITVLAIKSGNALLLKGGKEAQRSNKILVEVMRDAMEKCPKWPKGALQLIDTREGVSEMLKLDKYIDLVIPRGGNALVSYIKKNTLIPVLGHADGICAVYVDKAANLDKAARVVAESKTGYPSACNALETLLVHKDLLQNCEFVTKLQAELKEKSIEFRCDAMTHSNFVSAATAASGGAAAGEAGSSPHKIVSACDADFSTEFLCLTMAVKAVESVEEAIVHINEHGSHHTDCVCSEDPNTIEKFMAGVDSADVFANCSTRFADGFRFGFGAEIGISTNRIHSRGPVGLEGLVIYKYRMYGDGHLVGEMGTEKFPWLHKTRHVRIEENESAKANDVSSIFEEQKNRKA